MRLQGGHRTSGTLTEAEDRAGVRHAKNSNDSTMEITSHAEMLLEVLRGASVPLIPGARNPELGGACGRRGAAPARTAPEAETALCPVLSSEHRNEPGQRGLTGDAGAVPGGVAPFQRAWESAWRVTAGEVGEARRGWLRGRRVPGLVGGPTAQWTGHRSHGCLCAARRRREL
ncbi:hypothetical protein NDU88_000813 [Pleurodeles waltl]|uniref:Uncharacterized protein n=1 Tax=Pleurodeles waltl TaxID=8319 RepID=A0AAV7VVT1_PLEWA|nr:hypothetical protein NDU88_000813 [Pleurodeles waltl]